MGLPAVLPGTSLNGALPPSNRPPYPLLLRRRTPAPVEPCPSPHCMNTVYKTFERELIPTPGGGKLWDRAFFRIAILDELTGEERHQIYRMLRLQVHVSPDRNLDVREVLREAVCTPMDTPLRILQNTSGSELRFHARLSGGACHDSS
jgi:hypothetical protein